MKAGYVPGNVMTLVLARASCVNVRIAWKYLKSCLLNINDRASILI